MLRGGLADGGVDGGTFLLLVLPTALILLAGLLLVARPIRTQSDQPSRRPEEQEDDLAARVLGEDEARELRKQARRRRAVRRRVLRQARLDRSDGDHPGPG